MPNNLKWKVSSMLGKAPECDIPVKVAKCKKATEPKPDLSSKIVTSVNSIVKNMDQKNVKKLCAVLNTPQYCAA